MTGTVKRDKKAAEELLKNMHRLDAIQAKVGFFEEAKYEDGTPVAYVATIQEFGYPAGNIPPRPFMRPTVTEQKAAWAKLIRGQSKRVADGSLSVGQAFERVAAKAAGDVRKMIASIQTPALKKSTIQARKNRKANKKATGNLTKPLVDTGTMLAAVTYEVTQQ